MRIDMGAHRLKVLRRAARVLAAGAVCAALVVWAPSATAQEAAPNLDNLPGREQWQSYLEESPAQLEEFVHNPLETLQSFLPEGLGGAVRSAARDYAQILSFLLAVILLSFFVENGKNGLLDLAAAGGCGLLAWARLVELAEEVCQRLESWRTFLLGFVPVYSGVLTLGGEPAAAAAANGLFLTGLCLLAQLLSVGLPPLLHSYLALSVSCCISAELPLASACRAAGQLLRRMLGWAGRAFGAVLGLQRVFTARLDDVSVQAGRLLTGTVPVIGQSLNDAAQTVLAGVQLLKGGLGFAAMAILAVEFLPLYLTLMLHSLLLAGCGLICRAAGVGRCAALFDCLREAVRGLAAATALFFGVAVVGTALMLSMGGG